MIPDVSQDSDSFILGTEFPERIKTCVQNWNVENAKQCIRKFQNLEQQAEKEGFETLSQFLTAKISKTGTFEEIHYPAPCMNYESTGCGRRNLFYRLPIQPCILHVRG